MGVPIPERALDRKHVLPIAVAVVAGLGLLEWHFKLEYSLGIFYTLPVMIAATVLSRWQSVLFGILCADWWLGCRALRPDTGCTWIIRVRLPHADCQVRGSLSVLP